jgi:hypothetical protein
VLAAADVYQLLRLKRLCEQRMCRSIDADNAAHFLTLAIQHGASVSTAGYAAGLGFVPASG